MSKVDKRIDELISRKPELEACRTSIADAAGLLIRCYTRNGKVLVCGNGGSASDSAHIVGELMKGFLSERKLRPDLSEPLMSGDPEMGSYIAERLQIGLPAIDLTAQTALFTAFVNDCSPDLVFAQQVAAYGRDTDVLIGMSTSGNSKNVVYAAYTARMLGLGTIGLTGEKGGALSKWSDVCIAVPEKTTAEVQELHLPVYHTLCAVVEEHFFDG